MNMSYTELRRLPTRYRRWYLERLNKHFKDLNKDRNQESDVPVAENIKKIDDFIDGLKK
tara:strand:- start:497 stop:673 length:177 start_codon:yes stop_codon:yes gene_type:complete